MKADTLSVKKVFSNDTLLEIPFYQRHYVWNNDKENQNWTRFADDMENVLSSSRPYFLGALILKRLAVTDFEKDNGIGAKFRVIDGQQRLTTISIYMKLLHMMINDTIELKSHYLQPNAPYNPVLTHNCDDKDTYQKVMSLDQPANDIVRGAQGNIYEAYKYFLSRFQKLKNDGISLDKLRNRINAMVQFVVIELDDNDDEQQIFDTINSLGVDLTTDELLKNYLYKETDIIAYNRDWKPMFDTAEAQSYWDTDAAKSRQSKGRNNRAIDRLLHNFVLVKMWDFKGHVEFTDEAKKAYVKTENVYMACKDFVEKFGMSEQNLAKEIVEYAALYKANFKKNILDTKVPSDGCIERIAAMSAALNSYSHLPYVMYVLKNVSDVNERNAIFSYLESYLVRRLLVHAENKNYSDLFAENLVGQKVLTYRSLKDYIEAKDPASSSLCIPTDSDVKFALINSECDLTIAQVVWYFEETRNNNANAKSYNDYTVDRLMPVPGKDDNPAWPKHDDADDEKARLIAIKSLANAFLLVDADPKVVKKNQQMSLTIKKTLWENWSTEVSTTAETIESISAWDEAAITARATFMAKHFTENTWRV